jgi:cell division protein FtsW
MNSNSIHISIIERNIFSVILLLTAFGTVVMYSASSMINPNMDSNTHFLVRHLIWLLIGGLFGLIAFNIPLNIIKKNAHYILYLSIALIIIGIIINPTNDSARWLIYRNGAKQITTSDIGRLGLIIYTAWFLDKYRKKINDFKNVLLPFLAIIGLLFLSIVNQPDMSTTIVFGIILIILLFIGGLSVKYVFGIIGVATPFVVYKIFTTDYMRNRLINFIVDITGKQINNPMNEQVDKAIMAMGSAGFWGRGLGDGLLKKGFIPEIQGDFIFSVIGEELGLFSEIVVLSMFIYLFVKGIQLAQKAPNPFSMFLVLGISINFILYAIINVAYVIKLLPTTGLALPFISYGGTHTIVNFIMVGLLFNVSREIEKHGF